MAVRKQMVLATLAATVFGAMTGTAAQAAVVNVPVTNPSFETGDLTGWTAIDGGDWGGPQVTDNASNTPANPNSIGIAAADGTHWAYLEGGNWSNGTGITSLYQDVGALLPDTTYTLKVTVGAANWDSTVGASGSIALYNGTDIAGTQLASSYAEYGPNLAPKATWNDITVTYTTGNTVSGNLVVAMHSWYNYSEFINVDDVRLTAESVPEPASLALVGLGSLTLLARKRRA